MEMQKLEGQIRLVDTKIDERTRDLNDKIEQVLTVLVGKTLDANDKGYIGRMVEVEDRVDKLEKKWDRTFYIIIGMSLTTGGGLFALVQTLLK